MSVETLTEAIRGRINEPGKQSLLIKDKGLWYRLCSSLDVLEDTQLAIASFGHIDPKATKGMLYLAVYGLLQAMVVQQDAARHLCEALKLPVPHGKEIPTLWHVRTTRNDAVGHPTKRGKQPVLSYHFISRMTLTPEGFQLLSFDCMGTFSSRNESVPILVADQEKAIGAVLVEVLKALEQEQEAHRKHFMNQSLAGALAPMGHNEFARIYESIENLQQWDVQVPIMSLEYLRDRLSEFERALEKRDIEAGTYPAIGDNLRAIRHAMSRLRAFFEARDGSGCPPLADEDARVFCEFARARFSELVETASEVDKNYA